MTSDGHDLGAVGSYVLGGLDEDDSRSVEEHLTGCERCRQERTRLEEMTAALGVAASLSLPIGLGVEIGAKAASSVHFELIVTTDVAF